MNSLRAIWRGKEEQPQSNIAQRTEMYIIVRLKSKSKSKII